MQVQESATSLIATQLDVGVTFERGPGRRARNTAEPLRATRTDMAVLPLGSGVCSGQRLAPRAAGSPSAESGQYGSCGKRHSCDPPLEPIPARRCRDDPHSRRTQ